MTTEQNSFSTELSTLLDMNVRVDEVPTEGRKYEISADEETLALLIENSPASSISKFDGHIDMRPIRGGIEAKGRLKALLQQPCVVTLEPVDEQIDVNIERIYLRGEEPELDVTANGEVFVDLEANADNEWFDGDKIDLSDFIYEQFLLNLNPYPKQEGAQMPDVKDDDDPGEQSPFAALAALKPKE